MKFKSYPKHKKSGVEWLGDVPEHWERMRLKNTINGCINGYWGDDPDGENDIPVIRVADFNRDNLGLNFPIPTKRAIESKALKNRILKQGDLLLEKSGGGDKQLVGVVVLFDSEITAISANFIAKMTPKNGYNSNYILYVFSSLYSKRVNYRHINQTTGIQNINSSSYLCEHIYCSDFKEQSTIANFLDRETTRIDSLIKEKENFIALLKEKRQALISHTVTKGLDPTVKMKDSGVEWLGDVPDHWGISRIKYTGRCQNGINIGAESFGYGFPFVSYSDVYKNFTLPVKVLGLVDSSKSDRKSYSVINNDIFFTRTSETIEEIGFSSVCESEIEDACFAGFLIRFRPEKDSLFSGFSKYYFRNEKLRAFFVKEMNLITRASLSQDLLKKMPVLLPNLSEQKSIATYLDKQTTKIDLLVKETKTSIELLKEHRTALISAAVTGKIDVRHLEKEVA